MDFLPEPQPAVVAFLVLRRFVYLPVLGLLALARVIGGRALARWPALVALALCAGGALTAFAPLLGLTDTGFYGPAARAMAGGGGMTALLVPSVLLAISALMPDRRWRAIDLLHAALLAVLLGLWWWTS